MGVREGMHFTKKQVGKKTRLDQFLETYSTWNLAYKVPQKGQDKSYRGFNAVTLRMNFILILLEILIDLSPLVELGKQL